MSKMKGRSRSKAISAKISKLVMKEGMPQKRAVATALNMSRAGRLGPKGGYRRKKRKAR